MANRSPKDKREAAVRVGKMNEKEEASIQGDGEWVGNSTHQD